MVTAIAFAYVAVGLSYLAFTVFLARHPQPVPGTGISPQLFVFLVPALNERSVIRSTVDSLLAACDGRGLVVVIDDASIDETADVLPSEVTVLRRTLPDAQKGKGQALNHAYRHVREKVIAAGYNPHHVVLAIIDADGRLSPTALGHVTPYFRDSRVGAVQLLVRIRNRQRWLARFQDFEFLVFSSLTQTAREHLGSVGLGGNGQFTRLSALMELGDDPWTDCLTEDLDLGVRLAINGWKNRFCGETSVDQHGLTSIPKLVKQRTRWAHGHFQCWTLIPSVLKSQLPTVTAFDIAYYLLAPGLVLMASLIFTGTLAFTVYWTIINPEFWLSWDGLIYGVALYTLSFGIGVVLAFLYRRRSGELGFWKTLLFAHLLVPYNYVWYLAEWKALTRIIMRKGGWAKTARV